MVKTLQRNPAPIAESAPAGTRGSAARNFGWHFLEMCAAMCLAWMLVTVPFIAIARAVGTADPIRSWPELTTVVAAAAMSAGMAAEMRWRGHTWQCIAEMTAAMAIEAVVLIAAAAGGVFARADLFAWYHGLMPVAMVAAMVFRLDLYTSPLSHKRRPAVR